MGRHIQADGRSEIVHRCIGFGPAAPSFGLLPRLTDEAVLRQLVQILHHCGKAEIQLHDDIPAGTRPAVSQQIVDPAPVQPL